MVDAQDVTVRFRRGFGRTLVALDGFTVQVHRGDVFGLLGPNGAGKSTAMYCFLGLIRPSAGQIKLFGQLPSPGSLVFDKIAYVPEEPQYHLYLTVEEAVTFYGALYRTRVPRQRVEEAIARVGLSEFRDLRLEKCSKGMKQKVGLATCLLSDPELVFLDEPTRGLDPVMVKEFRDIVLQMNAQGTTFIMNSHVLSEVEMVCNRVAVMDRGRVLVQDALRNLLHVDLEHYAVTLGPTDALPEFVSVISRTPHELKGAIPTDCIEAFFQFARQQHVPVYACALKRASLEDVFMSIVQESQPHA